VIEEFVQFLDGSRFPLILKARYRELLEKLKVHLDKEQAGRAPFFLRSTMFRNIFGWWISGDFLRARKSCLRNVST